MPHIASTSLKVFYSLLILGFALPFGLTASGWVAMARGPSMFSFAPTLIAGVAFLALGGFRIYAVAKLPRTIDSLETTGFSAVLRRIGVAGVYVGGFVAVLNLLGAPLIKIFMNPRNGTGVEYFVAGMALSFVSGIGLIGLISFELSRLMAFEQQWRKVTKGSPAAAAKKASSAP